MKRWKNKIESFAVRSEGLLTAILIIVAVTLLAVAIFGKPQHKAMACIYIVL